MGSTPDEEIKKALDNNDPGLAASIAKIYLKYINNSPLNIAVTGESGCGKSTFVNALRGIDDTDETAAPTGNVETTIESKSYPHPRYPNVIIWDLPGIGTTKFPADQYLEHVGFEKFDFFIIVSAYRFRENDAKLAQEIEKMGKKFYFIRSKIDNNLRDAERSQRKYVEGETLQKIREHCIQGLEDQDVKSPQVFLVSLFDLHKYDFPIFQDTTERPDLMEVMKCDITGKVVTAELVVKMLSNFSAVAAVSEAKKASRLIPLFGAIVTAPHSYHIIYKLLSDTLDKLSVDTENVLTAALGI
ncbi:T-cell-specific guanine nucleotide triphosphate-binding protein 2 [Merluccius polli]|uniref:T-cell-specific guanine nucleotide triphosphate-binding protein 2 n=1 Tax=Merluccius polli TaxID=89951 RepID=A0AA47P2X3_MERPO|nr:T-cell-specific guanine nucleotide triphosphate-binding protein 2 [Merluccius polli]